MQRCQIECDLKVGAIIDPNWKPLQCIQAFADLDSGNASAPPRSEQCVSCFQLPKVRDERSALDDTVQSSVCAEVFFVVEEPREGD